MYNIKVIIEMTLLVMELFTPPGIRLYGGHLTYLQSAVRQYHATILVFQRSRVNVPSGCNCLCVRGWLTMKDERNKINGAYIMRDGGWERCAEVGQVVEGD